MTHVRQSMSRPWSDLVPYLPERSVLQIAMIAVLSFTASLAESTVLVLVTLTAESIVRGAQIIELFGLGFTRQEAIYLALALVLARMGLGLGAAALSAGFSSRIMRTAQNALISSYLGSSHSFRSQRPPGDLAAVFNGHGRFTGDLAGSLTMAAASVCGLVAFGGMSLAVNPLATIVIAAIGGLLVLAMRPLRRASQSAAQRYSAQTRTAAQHVTEVESLHREIEVFDVATPVAERAQSIVDLGSEQYREVRLLGGLVPQVFQGAMLAAAVISLLLVVGDSEADLGAAGAVVLLLVRSMSSAQQLVTANQRVVENASYTQALTDLISALDDEKRAFGHDEPVDLFPMTLADVGFSYDEVTPVLAGVTLRLERGELIGLVGPSGAGKSTLVELLLRLREPTAGSIRCGDTPIDHIDRHEFGSRVAFVPQQAVLIAGTVAENIDLFRGLPTSQLRRALEMASLDSEVGALPLGIDTMLGPDDRALSGGQRQRLCIARALAGDPDIIVLDEPTSALDVDSENAVTRTLHALPKDRTVVIVAHRYSTLKLCSRILVLKDGRIDDDGDPDDVMLGSDFFRSMVGETRASDVLE